MEARGFAAAAAGALLALAAGCTTADVPRLSESDDGATVTLEPGAELEAVLPANPSTGYSWVWPSGGTAAVVEPVGKPRFDRDVEDALRTGSGGSEIWRFRAIKPGSETVRLEYRRVWETASPPARTFAFTAVVAP